MPYLRSTSSWSASRAAAARARRTANHRCHHRPGQQRPCGSRHRGHLNPRPLGPPPSPRTEDAPIPSRAPGPRPDPGLALPVTAELTWPGSRARAASIRTNTRRSIAFDAGASAVGRAGSHRKARDPSGCGLRADRTVVGARVRTVCRIIAICVDCHDVERVNNSGLPRGHEQAHRRQDPHRLVFRDRGGCSGVRASGDDVQPVDGSKAGKNRMHVDLVVPAGECAADEIRRLVDLGTRVVAEEQNLPWVVLADPEGNEFCVRSATRWTAASARRSPPSVRLRVALAVSPLQASRRSTSGISGWQRSRAVASRGPGYGPGPSTGAIGRPGARP